MASCSQEDELEVEDEDEVCDIADEEDAQEDETEDVTAIARDLPNKRSLMFGQVYK